MIRDFNRFIRCTFPFRFQVTLLGSLAARMLRSFWQDFRLYFFNQGIHTMQQVPDDFRMFVGEIMLRGNVLLQIIQFDLGGNWRPAGSP